MLLGSKLLLQCCSAFFQTRHFKLLSSKLKLWFFFPKVSRHHYWTVKSYVKYEIGYLSWFALRQSAIGSLVQSQSSHPSCVSYLPSNQRHMDKVHNWKQQKSQMFLWGIVGRNQNTTRSFLLSFHTNQNIKCFTSRPIKERPIRDTGCFTWRM